MIPVPHFTIKLRAHVVHTSNEHYLLPHKLQALDGKGSSVFALSLSKQQS